MAEQELTDRVNETGGKTLETEWVLGLVYQDSCVYLANLQCQIDIIWRRWRALSQEKKKKKKQPISNLHMHIYLSDIAANSAVLWAAPLHLTNFSPFAQLVLADKCAGWWSIPFYTFPCQQQGPQIFCWNAKQEHIPDRLICKFGVKLFCGWCRMRGPLMCTHQEGVHVG